MHLKVDVQESLRQFQEKMLAEFRSISSNFTTSTAKDSEVVSQTAGTGEMARKETGEDGDTDSQNPTEGWTSEVDYLPTPVEGQIPPVSPSERTDFSHAASTTSPTKSRTSWALEEVHARSLEMEDGDDQSLKARISRVLIRQEFELFLSLAIMASALVMFWEGQYQGLDVGFKLSFPGRPSEAHVVWPHATTTFLVSGWAFGLLFLLEALVKIACWGRAYFLDPWNILDLLCVVTFLFDKVAPLNAIKPQMLRLLRLFRLVRLVRLLRYLEHLDHLYVMTTAVTGLSKVLGWAAFLLSFMLLACDLCLVQILHATYFSDVTLIDLNDEQLKKHHEMYAYFGTSTRCMLSRWEITLGNWPPVARLLSEEVSEWFALVCIIHKLSIGFSVVGVINGVILQETFKVAQTDDIIMLRQKKHASSIMRKKMEHLFEALDADGDGFLEREEFRQFVKIQILQRGLHLWT